MSAGDSDGTYTFTRDALDRITVVDGLFGTTLTMSYDAMGNRTRLEDNFGGVMSSTYNAENLLTSRQFGGTSQTPLRIDFTYNSRNQVATASRYSDLSATTKIGETLYSYDTTGRLENLHHKNGGGTTISNYTYTFDSASRVTSETLNSTTTSYLYDNTNQLTHDGTTSYSYDANGNRTMAGYTTGTGNQLTNDGTFAYTYDTEGNMTKRSQGASAETWVYTWDHRNQLLSVEKQATDGGTVQMRAEYEYDVFGNRIQQEIDDDGAGANGTVTTRFALDGWKVNLNGGGFVGNENWDVWADLDGSNNLTMRRIYSDRIDDVVARVNSSGTAAWYLTDRLGSVRDMTDNSGVVQNTIVYDGFGGVISESSSSFGDRYKYTGREYTSTTGLGNNRARDILFSIGRWISRDPLGFQTGDSNLYRYVVNSATNSTDPSGYELIAKDKQSAMAYLAWLQGSRDARWKREIALTNVGVRKAASGRWIFVHNNVDELRKAHKKVTHGIDKQILDAMQSTKTHLELEVDGQTRTIRYTQIDTAERKLLNRELKRNYNIDGDRRAICLDLQRKNQTTWPERLMMPSGTIWTGDNNNLDKMKAHIKNALGATGSIGRLTLTAHNGIPGCVFIRPGTSLSAKDYQNYLRQLAQGQNPTTGTSQNVEFLNFIREYLSTKDPTIDFVQCCSAKGKEGQQLVQTLRTILGHGVSIILYDEGVWWFFGSPRPTETAVKKR